MFKSVLKSIDAQGHILNYEPRALQHMVPLQALDFVKNQVDGTSQNEFEINKLTSETTGLNDIERQNFQSRIETEVLARLKEVEEKAYAEAHALGMQDGQAKAYEDSKADIQQAIDQLVGMTENLTQLKVRLVAKNEAHIVKTLFHVAKEIALKEIKEDPSIITNVFIKALENAQNEEEITLRINPKDAAFLEKVQGEKGNALERIQRLHVEKSDNVSPGGCVVETNYGVIDASIEQRVNRLWQVVEAKIPKESSGAS